MQGILVHGDNHFIVRGPEPTPEQATSLVQRWSMIQIGSGVNATEESDAFPWRVSTREFRENLEWAVVVDNGRPQSAAVAVLLEELVARGVQPQRVPDHFSSRKLPASIASIPDE
jgi:hypothetical protein